MLCVKSLCQKRLARSQFSWLDAKCYSLKGEGQSLTYFLYFIQASRSLPRSGTKYFLSPGTYCGNGQALPYCRPCPGHSPFNKHQSTGFPVQETPASVCAIGALTTCHCHCQGPGDRVNMRHALKGERRTTHEPAVGFPVTL